MALKRQHVPVIYVTAYSDEKTLAAVKQSMPYGFINKPIRPKDLKVNIEIALARTSADGQPGIKDTDYSVNEQASNRLDYSILSEALDHLVSGSS